MRKGQRLRAQNSCACGCGDLAPIVYVKNGLRKGQVHKYTTFIPGHGNKDRGRRMKAMPPGTFDVLPIGSTRLHHAGPTLVYQLVKIGPGRKGWRYEHRMLMEWKLGRRLGRKEHVHHKNEDTLDNRIENLMLLTHSEHSKHHHTMDVSRWAKKFDRCQRCGTRARWHVGHGLCTACYQMDNKWG